MAGQAILPTEPIGSIPRPPRLIEAVAGTGGLDPALEPLYDEAIRDTIARFEATGSPVTADDCGFSPFATTRRRPATRRSPRFGPGSSARPWPPTSWEAGDGREGKRGEATPSHSAPR